MTKSPWLTNSFDFKRRKIPGTPDFAEAPAWESERVKFSFGWMVAAKCVSLWIMMLMDERFDRPADTWIR